jgi:hypothetical protein
MAHEAELDNIVGLVDLLDEQGSLQDVRFVAAELDRLPKFGPEERNIGAVSTVSRSWMSPLSAEVEQLQQALNADSSRLSANHEVFDSAMAEIQKHIDDFQSSVNSRIDHLNSICTQ